MTWFEKTLGRLVLTSRYILIVFFIGLIAALVIYAAVFLRLVYDMALRMPVLEGVEALALMLSLIDAALVASLTIMVIVSNYESFVSRVLGDGRHGSLSWLGRLDPSTLKIKVGSTIIAISSVYLLKVLIDIEHYPKEDVMWKVIMFLGLVAGALALVWIDRFGAIFRSGYGNQPDPLSLSHRADESQSKGDRSGER